MNLMGMRFKDFTWRDNPTSLTVTAQRNLRETVLPYRGSRAEDLGQKRQKVTGEGYFAGKDCWEMWNALRAVYASDGPGYLQLPGREPFPAVMDSLKLLGASGESLIKYSFSFTEYQGDKASAGAGSYRAAAGESLWDYAWRYGRTVEELRRANPDIRDVGLLSQGQEVCVP